MKTLSLFLSFIIFSGYITTVTVIYADNQLTLNELKTLIKYVPNKKLYWYEKAAKQGLPQAQLKMGYFYHEGILVKKDTSQAMNWYKKALSNKEINSRTKGDVLNNIGLLYMHGLDVKKDLPTA